MSRRQFHREGHVEELVVSGLLLTGHVAWVDTEPMPRLRQTGKKYPVVCANLDHVYANGSEALYQKARVFVEVADKPRDGRAAVPVLSVKHVIGNVFQDLN